MTNYILAINYQGHFDRNNDEIILVGSKEKIEQFFLEHERNITDKNIKQFFKNNVYEKNADIVYYSIPFQKGFCLMAFCPGGNNKLEWYANKEVAIQNYQKTVETLKKNTNDEHIYNIRLYKIDEQSFTELMSDTAPYLE